MSKSEKHLAFLDIIRAIAILAVVCFHCFGDGFGYEFLPWGGQLRSFAVAKNSLWFLPISFGWAGVAIFFAVSGFCIHLSFANSKTQSFRDFFIRRFFRIYPPYFAVLVVMALGMAKVRHGLMSFSPDAWLDFLSHVFLLHNFTPYILSINTVFWSIAIEVQLYLLYPLLIAIVRRIGWTGALLVAGAIEVGLRGFIGCYSVGAANPWGDVLDSNLGVGLPIWFTCSPFVYWLSWAIGAFVAEGYITKGVSPLAKTSWTLWLLLATAAYFFKITTPFSFLLFAVATATVIAKLMSRATPVGSSGALRFIGHIGVWSYSLYLLHRPIIWAFAKWSHHSFLICLASLAISIPLSWAFHRYCEYPSAALGKKLSGTHVHRPPPQRVAAT